MLSVRQSLRRSTSTLLRSLAYQPHHSSLLSPHTSPHLPLQVATFTRQFSQQNDNSETLLGRLKSSLSDASQAAKLMAQEIRDVELSDDEATTLLMSFAKQKRVDDCIGLLRYCQDQRVATEVSARTMAFRTLSDAGEFTQSLQLFEGLIKSDNVELKPWMVGRALDAATKLNRSENVTKIFRLLTKNFMVKSDKESVFEMLKESGEKLDEFALRSIVLFADRAGESELALEVLDIMKKGGMEVTVDVYASVLEACGKEEKWGELVEVYNEMPDKLRTKLYSRSLSLVVRAHTRSKNEELVLRGLDIFQQHEKGKWSIFPCNAALEALLQTRQFDQLFALAGEMKEQGVKCDEFAYKMVTKAYIEIDSVEKAKQMLLANTANIADFGAECYRELIAAARGDCQDVCQLYMDMLQNNVQLELSDWRSALEHALQLPDQTMYWRFRKQLQRCHKSTEAMIPSRLLLSVEEDLIENKVSALPDIPKKIEFEPVKEATDAVSPQSGVPSKRDTDYKALTVEQASKCLVKLAKNKLADSCLELLSHCQEQNLSPDSSSRSAAFYALHDADRLEDALQVFETLRKDKIYLSPSLCGRVLDVATRLNRKELVLYIFRYVLRDGDAFKGYNVETTDEGIRAMLHEARDRGVKLSKTALRSLAMFADRSSNLELALDVLSIMQSEGICVTLDVHGSVLNLYGANKRWDDVLQVYESMPEHQSSQLNGASLSWVMTASTQVKDNQVVTHKPYNVDNPENLSEIYVQPKRVFTQSSTEVSDVSLARKSFNKIRNHGLVLSTNTASAFLITMATDKRVYDCIEMLRYFESQGVHPKPFALFAAYNVFSEAKEFDQALHVFETLYKSNCKLEPWVYAWAMDAATNLNRQESLHTIFHRMLAAQGSARRCNEDPIAPEKFQVKTNDDSVYGMLNDARDRGIHISEFALRSLASFADKSYQSELALDVFSTMQYEGMELTSEIYGTVLIACSKNELWSDVLNVFEGIPGNVLQKLSGAALGSVIMAHTKNDDDDLVARGLELFDGHSSKWSGFACNAALEAFLQTNRLDEVLTLANDMKIHHVKWSSFTYRMVTLAHIRSGSIDKARRLLQTHSKRMENDSTACYRELINYYARTREDTIEALQLFEEMMQNNWELQFSDWCTALEVALELPDHTTYWRVRKQLWMRGYFSDQKIPSHLLLPKRENPGAQVLSLLRDEGTQVVHEFPPAPANVALALEVFDDIWKAGGSGLTANMATKLLMTMAKYKRIDMCMEMLDYFKKQGVTPKPFARLAAFRAFCNEDEDEQALQLFETVLLDDLSLHKWVFPMALNAAMKLGRREQVTKIVDYMRKNGKNVTKKDYENISRKFGDAEEWGLDIETLSTMVREENKIRRRSSCSGNNSRHSAP